MYPEQTFEIEENSASIREERIQQLREQQGLVQEMFKKMKNYIAMPDHHPKEHLKQQIS